MFTKPFSEQTAQLIDEEVRRIVDEVVATTRQIINQERENIERIADVLLEKETIFSEDIEAILGKSAQQLAKEEAEALERTKVATTDDDASSAEGATLTSADGADIKYVIEPSADSDAEKTE